MVPNTKTGATERPFLFRLSARRAPAAEGEDAQTENRPDQFIVGITNSAPSLMPDGQREVTVLVLV